jgi:hypothetical protein
LVACRAVVACGGVLAGQATAASKTARIRVVTRNLNLGANLELGVRAAGLPGLVNAAGTILQQVDRNNFPVRAKGLRCTRRRRVRAANASATRGRRSARSRRYSRSFRPARYRMHPDRSDSRARRGRSAPGCSQSSCIANWRRCVARAARPRTKSSRRRSNDKTLQTRCTSSDCCVWRTEQWRSCVRSWRRQGPCEGLDLSPAFGAAGSAQRSVRVVLFAVRCEMFPGVSVEPDRGG